MPKACDICFVTGEKELDVVLACIDMHAAQHSVGHRCAPRVLPSPWRVSLRSAWVLDVNAAFCAGHTGPRPDPHTMACTCGLYRYLLACVPAVTDSIEELVELRMARAPGYTLTASSLPWHVAPLEGDLLSMEQPHFHRAMVVDFAAGELLSYDLGQVGQADL